MQSKLSELQTQLEDKDSQATGSSSSAISASRQGRQPTNAQAGIAAQLKETADLKDDKRKAEKKVPNSEISSRRRLQRTKMGCLILRL